MHADEPAMDVRVETWWCGFEWFIFNIQKFWSSIKFKIMKSLGNTWVFVRNPDTSKEIVYFVHGVHPVFAMTLSTFLHMLCGWDVIPCQVSIVSEFICSAFKFQDLIAEKISKCMKNTKWSQKGLKIDDVALNGAFWTNKKSGVQISSKQWNPFVTDEFSSEILILQKRLSILYTKCIQFLP